VLFSIRYHLGQSKPPFKVGSLFLPRASGFTIITGRLYRIERRFTSSPPCVRPLFEKARVKARGAKPPNSLTRACQSAEIVSRSSRRAART
jgi:hypothetical protein